MPDAPTFQTRFLAHARTLGLAAPDVHILVAVSGGCDSVVLLHLLRFAARHPRLTAAHFDHAMRPDSAADLRWVRGLCRAWGVPLLSRRAGVELRSEDEARRARLRFLRTAAREAGATHIATAHHADDQAETVLFRILRGTGLHGLGGIAPSTPAGFVRPLLPFWRSEVRAHARSVGLSWRIDATNRTLGPVRNRLRHRLLPEIERHVAPAARHNLVRLAELAREAEAGWSELLEPLERRAVRAEDGGLVLARAPFREYHPALASRLLRSLLRRFGVAPSRAGTRLALQFITDASSGRKLELSGGATLVAEFDAVRIVVPASPAPDEPLTISRAQAHGRGRLRLGGCRYRVDWEVRAARGTEPSDGVRWQAAFAPSALVFPLTVRGWEPGDRIRLATGTRRLKKLFGDRRVPVSRRGSIPLLVDAAGAVHWVAGLAQAPDSLPHPAEDAFHLTIVHG